MEIVLTTYASYQVILTVIFMITVLSLFIERALSVIFESKWYIDRYQKYHVKEILAVATSFLICFTFGFDAIALIFAKSVGDILGVLLTSLIVAGGSKGSMKFFNDFLNLKK